MPTYEYRCSNPECPSAASFEIKHSMNETCEGDYCLEENDYTGETCDGELKRVFTPTPAIFRGGGWGKITEWKARGH